ncbi:MAG: PAS domain S-box protein [Jatrophihabitans sp.]|uniref:PAS domain S-box protein n=1 Tax=Jatrophihabitans sp. TaxID=1932789 RepID=UPI003F7DFD4D
MPSLDPSGQRSTVMTAGPGDEGAFRIAFEASPVGMAVLDDGGRCLQVNQALASLLGADRSSLLGRSLYDFTHPDDVALTMDQVATAREGSGAQSFEKRYVRVDGAAVWCAVRLSSVRAVDGRRVHLAHIRDVSIEHELRQRELRERALLDLLVALQRDVAAVAHDRAAVLTLVAERCLEMIVGTEGTAIELAEQAHESDRLVYAAAAGHLASCLGITVDARASLSGLAARTGETLVCRDSETDDRVDRDACRRTRVRSMVVAPIVSDGERIGALKIASSRPDAFAGDAGHLLTLIAQNLGAALRQAADTEHIQRLLQTARDAAAAARRSEKRFRTAFLGSPLGMIVQELGDNGTRQVNAAAATMLGYTSEDADDMPHGGTIEPADRERFDEIVREMAAGQRTQAELDVRSRHRDGHLVDLHLYAAVVATDDGNRTVIWQIQDSTAQRESTRVLTERARLLELANDAIVVHGMDGTIRYWNPAAERIYGWSREAAVGLDIDSLLRTRWAPGVDRAAVRAALEQTGTWEGEVHHIAMSGAPLTVLARKALQRDERGEPVAILTINTDITERRAAEARLAASEALFRSQFEHSAVGQMIRTADGVVESANPAFAAMLGFESPDDLVGRHMSQLVSDTTATQRGPEWAELYVGKRDSIRSEIVLRRSGGTEVALAYTTSILRGVDGQPDRFVSIVQDVTEQRSAERARDDAIATLEQRNAELQRANALKTDLIGMLGHEMNNPLTVVGAMTELAADAWGADCTDEQRTHLEDVERNVQRLQRTVREVLDQVTLEAGHLIARPQLVELAPALRSVTTAVVSEVVVDCPDDVVALVQPEHLEHIVANLLSNADKYGGGAERIQVTADGGTVTIDVIDHGPGVPESFVDRLFTRFSRDEATGAWVVGHGLGLYIVRELARANGGDVTYLPTPGGGATFRISLTAAPG